MSNIYIQEPPSNGKVLLQTSLGDIDIELWSKEAPKACRNFAQLCMEGYYDGTIFHRVVKGFIAQGGDPTGTGTGGESIYGKPFKDEFHQRLQFKRRGLVAMANAGPDDNGSQFFFTLDRCEELQKKHTIFGKVTGNTIYNMIRLNDIEVDDNDRPIYDPPKIIKTEVLSCPFEDIQPRTIKPPVEKDTTTKEKIKSKSKATKNYKLLSFGDEAEEDEEETEVVTKVIQIKSSHDLLQDPKLSSVPAVDTHVEVSSAVVNKPKKVETSDDSEDDSEGEGESAMKKKKREDGSSGQQPKEEGGKKKKKEGKVTNDLMVQLVEERARYRKLQMSSEVMKKKGDDRQDLTLSLLASFTSKVNENLKEDTDDTHDTDDGTDGTDSAAVDSNWLNHKLQFVDKNDSAKDANTKEDDWYDIYDPRNAANKRRREGKGGLNAEKKLERW